MSKLQIGVEAICRTRAANPVARRAPWTCFPRACSMRQSQPTPLMIEVARLSQ